MERFGVQGSGSRAWGRRFRVEEGFKVYVLGL